MNSANLADLLRASLSLIAPTLVVPNVLSSHFTIVVAASGELTIVT